MPTGSFDTLKTWFAGQPPGRRLWLVLGTIIGLLGAVSLLGPSPEPQPGATGATAKMPGSAEIAGTDQKPGADGRAVKTVAVPRTETKVADTKASENKSELKPAGTAAKAAADVAKPVPPAVAAQASVEKQVPASKQTQVPAAENETRASKAWRGSGADQPSTQANSGNAKMAVTAAAPSAAPVGVPAVAPAVPAETAGKAPPVTPTAMPAPAFKATETSMKIQDIKSPGGISAWLVEEHSVPLLALRFVFDGGNSQDPAGREGLANFLTAMMDEGAGDLTAAQFQERMEELAVRMSFEDARDAFYGNFETLTANRGPALEMLRLALNKPRFDTDAVERIRKQLLANIAYAAKNPQQVAGTSWSEMAFAGHPYGRPASGTPQSVGAITGADLESFRKRTFARDTLRVVAVGDIDATALGLLLDQVFGDIAAKAELTPVAQAVPKSAEKLKVVDMDVPQSVVQFGLNGLPRKDPDFMAAFVMNHILGGGGFSSRLTEQVREKRGLAYSVYSYLQPFKNAALFAGGVATKNESVKESIDVIRAELVRMAKEGPTETELAGAKSNLTGSFALRFDTNSKIANQLLWMLHEDMGIEYARKRNTLVDAVTMDDVKRAAARILKDEDLLITVVGKPKGLGKS